MFCKLFYLLDGEKKEWPIDADPRWDAWNDLQEHVAEYIPDAKFLGFQMGEMFREEEAD